MSYPTTPAGFARAEAFRLRLKRSAVHVCRHCREPVRVSSPRLLPSVCPGCGAAEREMWVAVGRERLPRTG